MSQENLLSSQTITVTTAGTQTTTVSKKAGAEYVLAQAIFTYGSGGTSCKAYVQTSLDGGTTWMDIASFAFATTTAAKVSAVTAVLAATANTTPSDGALADNTILNGFIGAQFRTKVVSVGTYAATTLKINLLLKG